MYKSQKTLRFKPLASRRSIAQARRAAGLPPRRRGAQPGNSNRRLHGHYTRAALARRAELRASAREARDVTHQLKLLKRVTKVVSLLRSNEPHLATIQRIETRRAIRDAYAAGMFGQLPLRRPLRGINARCIAES